MIDIAQLKTTLTSDTSQHDSKLGKSIDMLKVGLVGAAGLAASAVVGVGAAAFTAWQDFDAGMDKITAKTGLIGDALAGMEPIMKGLKGSSAGLGSSMEDIGGVMGQLTAATGVTGKDLETLSSKTLKLAQLTGGKATDSVEGFTTVMKSWNLSADDMSGAMDTLLVISQKTGVGIGGINNMLAKFGPTMQGMGFSIEESAAMFATWEQAGLKSKTMMGGLTKAAGEFVGSDLTVREGLAQTIASIKNADNEAGAMAESMRVFGDTAGIPFAEAIRSGKLSVDELMASLGDTTGAIDSTHAATLDFTDQMGVMMGNLQVQLIPLGNTINELGMLLIPALGGALGWLIGMVTPVIDGIVLLAGAFAQAAQGDGAALQQLFTDMGGPMAAVGEFLVNIISNVRQFVDTLSTGGDPIQAFFDLLGGNFGAVSNLLGDVVTWIGETGLPMLVEQLGKWAAALWQWVEPQIPIWLEKAGTFLQSMASWVIDVGLPALVTQIGKWAKALIDWVIPQIPIWKANAITFLEAMSGWVVNEALPNLIEKLKQWGVALWAWIEPNILPLLGELAKLLGGMSEWILFTALPAIQEKLGSWVLAFLEWMGKDVIPNMYDKLQELSSFVTNWMINDALPAIQAKLVEWALAFLSWVTDEVIPNIGGELRKIWDAITGWITTTASDIYSAVQTIGTNIVGGIKQGLINAWGALEGFLRSQMGGLVGVAMDAIDSKSPSRAFADYVGAPAVQGIQLGMEETFPNLQTATKVMMIRWLREAGQDVEVLAVAAEGGATFLNQYLDGALAEAAARADKLQGVLVWAAHHLTNQPEIPQQAGATFLNDYLAGALAHAETGVDPAEIPRILAGRMAQDPAPAQEAGATFLNDYIAGAMARPDKMQDFLVWAAYRLQQGKDIVKQAGINFLNDYVDGIMSTNNANKLQDAAVWLAYHMTHPATAATQAGATFLNDYVASALAQSQAVMPPAGVAAGEAFQQGVNEGATNVALSDEGRAAMQAIVDNMAAQFADRQSRWVELGRNALLGFQSGLNGEGTSTGGLAGMVGTMFGNVVGNIKGVLGIASPSAVFKGLAEDSLMGWNSGMTNPELDPNGPFTLIMDNLLQTAKFYLGTATDHPPETSIWGAWIEAFRNGIAGYMTFVFFPVLGGHFRTILGNWVGLFADFGSDIVSQFQSDAADFVAAAWDLTNGANAAFAALNFPGMPGLPPGSPPPPGGPPPPPSPYDDPRGESRPTYTMPTRGMSMSMGTGMSMAYAGAPSGPVTVIHNPVYYNGVEISDPDLHRLSIRRRKHEVRRHGHKGLRSRGLR